MKALFTILLLSLSLSALAADNQCEQLKTDGATQEQLARSGCCSHHNGVCGCDRGRTVCCDGSYSPSCGCHADDQKEMRPHEADTPKT